LDRLGLKDGSPMKVMVIVNIIDSSCWIEYFSGDDIDNQIFLAIETINILFVLTITIYEFFKKILLDKNRHDTFRGWRLR
jgi:hypothetical protein